MALKRIIVAYDASEPSREALAYAIEIGKAASCEIVVFRAIEPPPPAILPDPAVGVAAEFVPPMDTKGYFEEEHRRAAAEVPEAVEFARRAGLEARPEVYEGFLLEGLEDLACEHDMIAVGEKGRFAEGRMGSATASLVKEAPCPLLIADGPMRDLARVLCVFDDADRSRAALRWAQDLAEQTQWPLTVLAVTRVGDRLESVIKHAEEQAPDAMIVHFGPDDLPEARQIEAAAMHAKYSLIVMGAFTDGWFHRLVFGGTTDQVIRRLEAPVVLVGPRTSPD